MMTQAYPRFSTQWATDPMQQIGYLAVRKWARRFTPDVLLGVYTPDEARARSLLAQVRAGSVYWNCCDRVSPRLPWSGVGDSGVGLTLSTYGIQTFTRPKAWHLRAA